MPGIARICVRSDSSQWHLLLRLRAPRACLFALLGRLNTLHGKMLLGNGTFVRENI